jgi:hypothetical protein
MCRSLALLLLTDLPKFILSALLLLSIFDFLLSCLLLDSLLTFCGAASASSIALERATGPCATLARLVRVLGGRTHMAENRGWLVGSLGTAEDIVG